MKRCLLFSFEYLPVCGGAGRVALDTADFLVGKGVKLDVLTTFHENMPKVESARYFLVRYVPVIFPIFFFFKMRKILKKNEYDSIILNDVGAILVVSLFFREIVNRCIAFIHGTEIEFVVSKPKLFFRLIDFPKRFVSLLEKCKKIVCVSEFMKKKIMNHLPQIDENQIIVVHNGTNRNVFFRQTSNIREKHNIPSTSSIIYSASRINEMKGYGEVYEVFKKLISAGYDFYWIIAGIGPYQDVLECKALVDGLDSRIIFLGKLSADQLRIYYSSCDVFVLLSKYEEAFGLVYLEAISCGIPVVANDLGGVNEVVKNGVNGFLVHNLNECFDVLSCSSYKRYGFEQIINSVQSYDDEKENLLENL